MERAPSGELLVGVHSLDDAERRLVAVLAGSKAMVVSLGPVAPSLEDVFLELTT